MKTITSICTLLCLSFLSAIPLQADDSPQKKTASAQRKIVLIAGPKSHGPTGNGIHDYPWSVKLLKVMLDNSNVKDQVRVEYHLDGWPEDPGTLNDADTIMVISDGRDGNKFAEAPHFGNAEHLKQVQRQIDRGCGFLTFHFSTFAPDKYAQQIQDWSGGYFDWEENGLRRWYSAIKTVKAPVHLIHPEHPTCRGVKDFELREEFYFNLRFQDDDPKLTPLFEVTELKGRKENGNVVAWAKERQNGGRGFGTTCGHYYDNWQNDAFRKFILNAIAWTANVEVPETGVQARYYTHAEITTALAGIKGTEPAIVDNRPIRVLMFAGNEAHAWHNWKKTTPVIKELLEKDPRIKVDVSNDIEDLSKKRLSDYQVIVQNYANWHDGTPLSQASRTAFMNYLQNGGGLVLIHFANGAFHFSLPKAGESDWPEYRKIVRRVWNHHGKGDAKSGHDAFGKFEVQVTDDTHPLTHNLKTFPVTDELYFRQDGTEPVEPLISANSKVTKKNEPLAWTYHYGNGRIFQTLLGHSEKTYDTFEACEILRRATAWAAQRPIHEFERPEPAPGSKKQTAILVPGKWGKALNTNTGTVLIASKPESQPLPLSADCWVKLNQKNGFNVFLASEEKSSPAHWEMYSYARSGYFSVYLPGQGGEYKTKIDICDQKWHYVGMILEPNRLRLFVDGKQELDSALPTRKSTGALSGKIRIGGLVENRIGSDGLIDDVRLSKGQRDFTMLPTAPMKTDGQSLYLFPFNELTKTNQTPELVSGKPVPILSKTSVSQKPAADTKKKDHWGKESVGFSQPVSATDDNRWQQTDIGKWLACTIPLPTGPVKKGLSIRVGEHEEGTICYDTQHCKVRGLWTDGFLKPSPERFGLIKAPSPIGNMLFSTQEGPGWDQRQPCQFLGSHVQQNRVTLEYRIGETTVYESPWFLKSKDHAYFTRTFEIGPGDQTLKLHIADAQQVQPLANQPQVFQATKKNKSFFIGTTGWDAIRATIDNSNKQKPTAAFVIPPRNVTRVFTIYYQTGPAKIVKPVAPNQPAFTKSLQPLLIPGPPHWKETLTTKGTLGKEPSAYVVDTITIPHQNPFKALFFISGHDFLENGNLAVSTVHGDVWLVSGVDDDLQQLKWKRFATGLFQPLGLKVVDNQIHVLGRDQITILHDQNQDGEADFYECFNNMIPTSVGGHDYVTCLETDSFGNFYLMHAQKGVVQITRDGKKLNVIASGFRNPNGMGMGPGNIITASPQEGTWTPASNIAEVKPGGYYGYGGPKITTNRPLGYDPPLCWIPRLQDNSSGGQVWATSENWGPLKGQLLHLSYGQSKILLTLREVIHGQSQGGTLTLPLEFESGIMRGRFSPADGQLYVSGLKGWVTNAVQDGCLQRVRYTGKPIDFPIAVKTMQNGIALTFTNPLERTAAENPDHYAIEQWNYLWSEKYGSPEFKVSSPQTEGRDEVEVLSATLLPDQRTVFLELASVKPVMQMGITYHLTSQTGAEVKQTYYHTINSVSSQKMDSDILTRRQTKELLTTAQQQQLKPGVLWTFSQKAPPNPPTTDARAGRMIALSVSDSEAPTPFLKPGPFSASAESYLRVPLTGRYQISLEGFGTAGLKINQQPILNIESDDFSKQAPVVVTLNKGFNQIQLTYQSKADGNAKLRLLWSGDHFAAEPVLPSVLSHMSNHRQLVKMQQLRQGRELIAHYKCLACHSLPNEIDRFVISDAQGTMQRFPTTAMPDLNQSAPDLVNIGNRVSKRWLFHWLLNPHSLREHSNMPALLGDPNSKLAKQQAADLTAWFVSQARKPAFSDSANPESSLSSDIDSLIESGAQNYELLGCINCHHQFVSPEEDEYQRHSLARIKRKFSPSQLTRFLRTPHQHNQWSRMPDFKLTQQEALALSLYLIDSSKGKIPNAMLLPDGSAKRGHKLYYETLGCVNCHGTLSGTSQAVVSPRRIPFVVQSLSNGCLSELREQNSQVPQFELSQQQQAAIKATLKTQTDSLARLSPPEVSERWMRQLNCAACHSRDTAQSPRGMIMVEEGDSGLLPEALPSLTWAGEKLKSNWSKSFIAGEVSWRPRPWLKSRMPHFPAHAVYLASGMAAEHGIVATRVRKSSQAKSADSPQMVTLGNQLTRKNALDCRQCHGVGDELPLGDDKTKIALGINFVHIKERLHDDYYHRFVLDPPRFDIATKMPKLSADGKTTKISAILEGDAHQQFHAIWKFIQSLNEQPRTFSRK
ncbi:ThuA domain-containing protein [Gimesia fumaroli]|uniref:Trehalose utilization n=1 Tax=Gimesia fumaroli TaxID=2527976 RepID=A0A518IBK5_9PLAN|nr:ThuA domain-containing protein [Gimesia fumaroli]QDV50409.1 Trehalose utilization [Gimesia fumaroli]